MAAGVDALTRWRVVVQLPEGVRCIEVEAPGDRSPIGQALRELRLRVIEDGVSAVGFHEVVVEAGRSEMEDGSKAKSRTVWGKSKWKDHLTRKGTKV